MIDPLLVKWDNELASDSERALIRRLGWELPQPARPAALAAGHGRTG
jgi:hypothetical protein